MTVARAGGARRPAGALAFLVAFGLAPGWSHAQVNDGRIAFTTGIDFSHAYFFRGIRQEREGFIIQPYADLAVDVYSNPDGRGLTGAVFTLGQWNSLHTGPTGADGPSQHVGAWYESDFFTGLTLVIDNWEAGVTYTSYLSPNHTFGTTQEVAFSVGMDDSALLEAFALSPHAVLAIETAGGADGGGGKGVYLEIGVEPGTELVEEVVSVSFPVTFGFSLSNYYENGLPPGSPRHMNDRFGFFGVGAVAAAPLPVAESLGAWELAGGVQVLALGEYVESLNDGDQFQIIGSFGVSIGY